MNQAPGYEAQKRRASGFYKQERATRTSYRRFLQRGYAGAQKGVSQKKEEGKNRNKVEKATDSKTRGGVSLGGKVITAWGKLETKDKRIATSKIN